MPAFDSDVIACRDAATGEQLGEVTIASPTDVHHTHQKATLAARTPALRSIRRRRSLLAALLDRTALHLDELCRVCAHTTGKTMLDTLASELVPALAVVHRARSSVGATRPELAVRTSSVGPDNPLRDLLSATAFALRDAHGLVLALDPATAWSSLAAVELIHAVLGDHQLPAEIVSAVVADESVPAHAPATIAIIDAGADVERAATNLVHEAFVARRPQWEPPTTLLVHASLTSALTARLATRMRALRHGPPLDPAIEVGALSGACFAHVKSRVDAALARGARASVGGAPAVDLGPNFFAPTLLSECSPEMAVVREACPGRALSLVEFRTPAELTALIEALAKDTACRMFTGRTGRARAAAVARAVPATIAVDDGRVGALWTALTAAPDGYAHLEVYVRLMFGTRITTRSRAALDGAQGVVRSLLR